MKQHLRELMSWLVRLVFERVGLLLTSGDDRVAEILALRHQVRVLCGGLINEYRPAA